ncbi:polysaccharide deacetylase family protein [Brevibacillus reuszeri]|uniref:polysaccharide deacetylase family protein n=1 Tax=Brevibacillus reuszeri TaxID=54915 RepID=UPI003D1D4281
MKLAVLDGHYVRVHSMTHQLYEEGRFVYEMKENSTIIHNITGENPHFVRPPYGSVPGLYDKMLCD